MTPEQKAVLTLVKRMPGETCARFAAVLGEPCPIVSAHLRALRDAGYVRSEGNTRGTKWSAVK